MFNLFKKNKEPKQFPPEIEKEIAYLQNHPRRDEYKVIVMDASDSPDFDERKPNIVYTYGMDSCMVGIYDAFEELQWEYPSDVEDAIACAEKLTKEYRKEI